MRLTLGTPLQGRDGYGLVLLFSMRPPATAGMTMLQTRASRKRAVDERLTHGQVAHTHGPQLTHTLCLEELIEGPGSTLQLCAISAYMGHSFSGAAQRTFSCGWGHGA